MQRLLIKCAFDVADSVSDAWIEEWILKPLSSWLKWIHRNSIRNHRGGNEAARWQIYQVHVADPARTTLRILLYDIIFRSVLLLHWHTHSHIHHSGMNSCHQTYSYACSVFSGSYETLSHVTAVPCCIKDAHLHCLVLLGCIPQAVFIFKARSNLNFPINLNSLRVHSAHSWDDASGKVSIDLYSVLIYSFQNALCTKRQQKLYGACGVPKEDKIYNIAPNGPFREPVCFMCDSYRVQSSGISQN